MNDQKELSTHPVQRRVFHVAIFLLLLIVAVPWYWNLVGLDPVYPLIFGLPRWFVIVIGHSFIVSVYTAWCICTFKFNEFACDQPDEDKTEQEEQA